jgi:hypothetical protein
MGSRFGSDQIMSHADDVGQIRIPQVDATERAGVVNDGEADPLAIWPPTTTSILSYTTVAQDRRIDAA